MILIENQRADMRRHQLNHTTTMPYAKTTTAPGTCPICAGPRLADQQITCARCWHHVLNGKDREQLAALYRRKAPVDAKCAKIARRVLATAEKARAKAENRTARQEIPPATPEVIAAGVAVLDAAFAHQASAEGGL